MAKLELSDMIVGPREELLDAQTKGADQGLRFDVEQIEIEAQVTVAKSAMAETKGGWKFWVVDAEAKIGGEISKENVHTVKVTLKPKQDGEPLQVDRDGERPQ